MTTVSLPNTTVLLMTTSMSYRRYFKIATAAANGSSGRTSGGTMSVPTWNRGLLRISPTTSSVPANANHAS
jgi:hypothetical protein